MSSERFVFTQYCDDVRQEVGDKVSLMGCYGGDLIVSQPSGVVVLPKLCAQVRVVSPIERPFRFVIFRAMLNDEVLAELRAPESPDQELPAPPAVPDARTVAVNAILTFVPMVIGEGNASLRVVVETEEGVIQGNALRLIVKRESLVKH